MYKTQRLDLTWIGKKNRLRIALLVGMPICGDFQGEIYDRDNDYLSEMSDRDQTDRIA